MSAGIDFKRMPHPRERDASGLRPPVPAATASNHRLLRGIGMDSTAFRPPNPESAGAVPVGRILVGNAANVARGIYGLPSKPVERTPYMAPRGQGLSFVPPRASAAVGPRAGPLDLGAASPLLGMVPKPYRDTVASSARGLPMTPRPMETVKPVNGGGLGGPMSGIYAEEALSDGERGTLKTMDLRGKYNSVLPRSEDRAQALRGIWDRGGVPVIGGGAQRAAREDFGGVDMSPRGIDTGRRPGREPSGGGLPTTGGGDIYGGGGRRTALAAQDRLRGIPGLTKDRTTRNPSREERTQAAGLAMERAKGESTIEAARLGAAADMQKANIAAKAERYKAVRAVEIAQDSGGPTVMPTPPRLVKIGSRYHEIEIGTDGVPRYNPLSDAEQLRKGKIDAALSSLNEPETRDAAFDFVRNPDKRMPMYDWKTGRIAFMEMNPRWDLGKPNWQKEMVARGQPRYEYLNTVDPELMERLIEWLHTTSQEEN